jgi:hypothetical protein
MRNNEILKDITRIISESPSRGRLAIIASDSPTEDGGEIKNVAEIPDDNNKYLVFTEEFNQDYTLMKKLPQILEYVHSQGYTTNLD